jgi:hypothetical protein
MYSTFSNFVGRRVTLRSGNITRFWKDPCDTFPGLFKKFRMQECIVKNFIDSVPAKKYFIDSGYKKNSPRRLYGDLAAHCDTILRKFDGLSLRMDDDVVSWGFDKQPKFFDKICV